MKDQYKNILKKALYYCGYYSLHERIRVPPENRLLILMYHDVMSDVNQLTDWYGSNNPSESQLEAVLVTLKKNYRVISVEDAVLEIRNTGVLKEKSVAITFDDGYLSTFKIAFPLLKKYAVPATIYLPTDWIDGRLNPWWMTLTSIIDLCDLTLDRVEKVERILGKSVDLNPMLLRVPANAKQVLRASLADNLMRENDTIREQLMLEIRNALLQKGEFIPHVEKPMTWEQVKEMAANGITFGAHTCSHPNLSHVDLEVAEREMIDSKRIIESRLGVEVSGFAYPYGYDLAGYRRLRPILHEHGFLYACTSWWGYVDSRSDLYLLRRTGLPLSTSPAILSRALSLEYCMKRAERDVS